MKSFVSIVGLIVFSFALSIVVAPDTFAQHTGTTGGSDYTGVTGGNSNASLKNPLESDSLLELLQQLLDVILVFAVPLIVFMIIYAGFIYVTARGNPGQVGKAHNALLFAVVGGVLILGAWVIMEVIQGTVDAFR